MSEFSEKLGSAAAESFIKTALSPEFVVRHALPSIFKRDLARGATHTGFNANMYSHLPIEKFVNNNKFLTNITNDVSEGARELNVSPRTPAMTQYNKSVIGDLKSLFGTGYNKNFRDSVFE